MGKTVNSEANETGICFSPQTGIYYFASDRRGNYDIYSYRQAEIPDSTNGIIAQQTMTGETEIEKQDEAVPAGFVVPGEKPVTESPYIGNLSPGKNCPDIQVKMQFVPDTVSEKNGKTVDAGVETVDKEKEIIAQQKIKTGGNRYFYTLQLMSLKPETFAKEYFREKLDSKKKYFVVHENGLVKIRTGRFSSYREAYKYATEQKVEAFFIVRMNESLIVTYL